MFCEGPAMNLSAANLLAAAQQAARQIQQPQPNAKAFSAALSTANGKEDLFAPLDFKQAASPAPSPVGQQSQGNPTAAQRPGANLDIRI
jgi:hypothetical protein